MRVLMTRPRYWCPDCDAVLIKPPRLINGQRFHSGYCTTPMEPVVVVPRTDHREARAVSTTIVETRDEFDQLCIGTVVRSAQGTISARYSRDLGVVFGDERPIPWIALALPVQVLWSPRADGQVEQ